MTPDPDRTLPPASDRNEATTMPPSDSPRAAPIATSIKYFGDYELLAEIARGGMGVVYRARQVSLNREVALKMILSGALASPADVRRFHHEAEAAANLDHAHILPIYEVSEHQGQHFFSMKLIEGNSLADEMKSGRLGARDGVAILVTVARAVHFAHLRGILHRDLKPANILLDRERTPFVTDFGLAKKVEGDSGMTHTGAILGTPSYMAPEQARAEKQLTTAVDVYSLGAILYEMIAGRPPFRAATMLDTILQVVSDDPENPRTYAPNADRDLSVIALKCLEKSPAKRYASAEALAEELGRWQRGEPIVARPALPGERTWKWVRRNPAIAALTALVAISLVVGTVVSVTFAVLASRTAVEAKARAREAQEQAEILQVGNGVRAMDAGDWYQGMLWFAQPLTGDPGVPVHEEAHRRRLSTYVRYALPARLSVRPNDMPRSEVLGRDGSTILIYHDVNTHALQVRDVLTNRPIGEPFQHAVPSYPTQPAAISSDGSRLLTLRPLSVRPEDLARLQPYEVGLWNTRTGQPMALPVAIHTKARVGAFFTPDGRKFVTANMDGTARLWDAATGRPLGQPLADAGPVIPRAFSPDGLRLVTTGKDNSVRVWDVNTGRPISPLIPVQADDVAFGVNGDRLVTRASGTVQVWNAISGRPSSPPLEHSKFVAMMAINPDGRRVLTATESTIHLWDVATGRSLVSPLTYDFDTTQVTSSKGGANVRHLCFTADGRRAVIVTSQAVRVWDFATDTAPAAAAADRPGDAESAVSPDGTRYAQIRGDGAVRLFETGTTVPVSPPMLHGGRLNPPVFSADGRWLLTSSGYQKTIRVWDVGTGHPISPLFLNTKPSALFAADGELVLSRGDKEALEWNIAADPHSNEDWVRLAQFWSARRLDRFGGFEGIADPELAEMGTEVEAKFPHLCRATASEAAAWHRRELIASALERNAFAVACHLYGLGFPMWWP